MKNILKIFILVVCCSFAQSAKIDSLKKVLLTSKEDTNKVNILCQLSEECEEEDILKYAEPALQLAEKLNYKKGIASALNNIGFVYEAKGQVEKALECFIRAFKIREEIGDKHGLPSSLTNIGYIYGNQGQMQKALEYFMKALKITEENNDKQGHAYALNNIGFIYDRQGQREKAFECLMKALKIREEIGDKRGVAESLNNIGWNYDHQGQTEKGLEYFKKSLKLTEEIDDKHGIAHTLNNIGGVYLDNCKLKTTSDPLKKTLLDSALAYSSRSLTISKEIGFPENIRNASEQLTEIYKLLATSPLTPLPKRLDFWQSAYEMYELYKIMADSISNMEIHKASMQYEFDKREAQAKSEQEKKDLKAVAEKRRQQLILILVMAIAAAAGAIAVVIFRSLRITRRQKLAIEEQKKVVEEKQKEILDSIHYARRIQQSLLPTEKYIDKTLKRLSKNN